MTDSFTTETQKWLQEQSERWQEILKGHPTQEAPGWDQFLKQNHQHLYKHLGENLGEHHEALIQLVNSQSSRFIQFAEAFIKDSQSDERQNTEQLIDKFSDYLQQQCNEMLTQQWNLPEPFASMVKQTPINSHSMSEAPLQKYLEQLAVSPDLGNLPFSNTQIRTIATAMIEYQDALKDYLDQYDQIFSHASEHLKQALQQPESEIDSIRALHNIWVECYEKAYADRVFTPQYQASHGRISNSLMQARKLAFEARDLKLREFGFVTREELDSSLKLQHQMRKQIKTQSNEIKELKEQVAALIKALSNQNYNKT